MASDNELLETIRVRVDEIHTWLMVHTETHRGIEQRCDERCYHGVLGFLTPVAQYVLAALAVALIGMAAWVIAIHEVVTQAMSGK